MIGYTNSLIIKGNEAQLYDTKVLTTANAETGWVYNNTNSYRSFSSSTLPTLFNDISTKLNNKEGAGISSQVTSIPRPDGIGTGSENQIFFCNNTYFCAGFYYNTTNNTWIAIDNTIVNGDGSHQEGTNICFSVANKTGSILILFGQDNKIYKVDTSTKNWKYLGDTDYEYFPRFPRVKEYNNILYVWEQDRDSAIGGIIYAFNTSYSSNVYNVYNFGDIRDSETWEPIQINQSVHDLLEVNGDFYILQYKTSTWYPEPQDIKIYKGSSLSHTDLSDTSYWTCILNQSESNFFPHNFEPPSGLGDIIQRIVLDYKDGYIWFISCMERLCQIDLGDNTYDYEGQNKIGSCYTNDDFITRSSPNFASFNNETVDFSSSFYVQDDYIYISNRVFDSSAWEYTQLKISYLSRTNLSGATTDLTFNFGGFNSFPSPSKICFYDADIESNTNPYIYDLNISSGLYTDQYIVNNVTVNIDYYKYNNFKICTYSSLTTLNSLYTQYGYSVYWNLHGNQVSIPMNAQNYSVLYVGDNYIDNS